MIPVTSDGTFMYVGNHKLRVGQLECNSNCNFSDMYKYSIDDDVITKHFVLMFGMVINIKSDDDLRLFNRNLKSLASALEMQSDYDLSNMVYCITNYTDGNNWTAKKLDNGIIDRTCGVVQCTRGKFY